MCGTILSTYHTHILTWLSLPVVICLSQSCAHPSALDTDSPTCSRWLKCLQKSTERTCTHSHKHFHMVAEHGCPRERGRPRLAEHIVDVLVPLIMEEIVEALKNVFQEQISERICKQIVEQVAEVPKTSSRDRILQRAAEQIPNVPVPEMVTQLAEVPETVSRDGVQQRTVVQIVDAAVPQAVEELAEVSRVFSQDRI